MIPYIIKALQQNKTICVNDLGTFTLHYVSARIEGENILPPHNEVILDTFIEHEDITFASFVSREKRCQLTKANNDIATWVEELKRALIHNKSVMFDGFGTFFMSEKGKLSFSYNHIAELNEEFEGMTALTLEKSTMVEQSSEVEQQPEEEPQVMYSNIAEESPMPEVEEQPEEEPQVMYSNIAEESPMPEVEQQPQEEPQVLYSNTAEESPMPEVENKSQADIKCVIEKEDDNEDTDTKIEKKRKKRSLWWLWTLIILIVFAILGVCGYLFYDKIASSLKAFKIIAPQIEQIDDTAEDTPETITDASWEEEIEEEEKEMESSVEPYRPEAIRSTADGNYNYIRFEQGKYYVIAGSLPTEKDAETHIRQKGLDQYQPYLLLQNGVGNIRVCIGIYDTEVEAEQFAKGINTKYWVLK